MVNTNNNKLEINIDIATQQLRLLEFNNILFETTISSAKNGIGELFGSECTPTGKHIIRAKIGSNSPVNSVFVARRITNEIYSTSLKQQFPDRDWILTRIMWLSGLELKRNRLGNVDTMRRYIYIHGCPDEDKMGVPSSHGCIKMRNSDVMKLYNMVSVGTKVSII